MEKILQKVTTTFQKEDQEKIVNVLTKIVDVYGKENNLVNEALETAKICLKTDLDCSTIVACFLLPFLREITGELDFYDTDTDAKNLAQTVIKIENVNYKDKIEENEKIRSMFVAIAKDIRVIIVKLANVLVKARSCVEEKSNAVTQFFKEVEMIYAPLAARLGFSYIKSELQDLTLKFNRPIVYKRIYNQLNIPNREEQIKLAVLELQKLLTALNIEGKVSGRVKHVSSIYNKMQNKNLNMSNIYDLAAARVIVNSVNECYAILGAVHSVFMPVDNKFKDYIAKPKANGYQSLHTTVFVSGEPLEIQIRTKQMHNHAEYGVAAHFMYKEKKQKAAALDEKLIWIRQILENEELLTTRSLKEELKTDVYSGTIFVQTPQGKILELPEGSTPLDFAYQIHSDIGNKCMGAKVNGKFVPISYSLNNGDVVEITTNPNSKGPSRDWLNVVKSNAAKTKIRNFFKKEMKDENIKKGKSMLEQAAKQKNLQLSKLLVDEFEEKLFEKYCLKNEEEMFASVGFGSLTTAQVINKLYALYSAVNKNTVRETDFKNTQTNVHTGESVIKELPGMMIKFAQCCSPVFGDEIIGYVSRGSGVTVHRKNCSHAQKLETERMLNLTWGNASQEKFMATIVVYAKDKAGVFASIVNKIAENKVNIDAVKTAKGLENTEIVLKLKVSSKQEIDDIVNKISQINEVVSVERLISQKK